MTNTNIKGMIARLVMLMMMGIFSLSASAMLIDASSETALFGTYSADNGDLTLATTLTFADPALIAAGVNDFAFAVGSNASLNAITIDPSFSGQVLSFGSGGSFTANSLAIDLQTSTALDITLTGFWSLDGFDDTAGTLVLTADSLGGLFTFSASGTVTPAPVPVPAAVWLLGSALLGLGFNRRR
ncbi:MAG: VPLPA-CTERM sorting domain-containing protein [Pseudomonadota bacterium]